MKITALSLFAIVLLFACDKPETSSTATPDVPATPAEITAPTPASTITCYLLTEGTKNQDSTHISLTMDGDKVTGTMDWVPDEKDSARGTLDCTKKGDLIEGTYAYIIEGSNQTEQVRFKLENGVLSKYEGELEDKKFNGNLTIKEGVKGKYVAYTTVPCK